MAQVDTAVPSGCSGSGPEGSGPIAGPGVRGTVTHMAKMSPSLPRSRPTGKRALLLAGAGTFVIVLVAVVIAALTSGASSANKTTTASAAERRAAERGWTDKVTVALVGPTQMRPSEPRPAKLPPMIRSTGACADAMNAVRDFQDANPSGLVLTAAQYTELTKLMAKVGPGAHAACSTDLATKFRLQELIPWQSWQPPTGTKVTSSPGHRPAKPAPHPAKSIQSNKSGQPGQSSPSH